MGVHQSPARGAIDHEVTPKAAPIPLSSAGPRGTLYEKMLTLSADTKVPSAVRTLAKAAAMSLAFENHPAKKHAPVRVLVHLWAWQLWRRTLRRPVTVELQDGALLICPEWSALSGAVVSVGITDVAELSFVADVIREGEVVVDVGCNIGLYAVIAARRKARVIAFDPTERARAALLANARLNGVESSIECLPCALSDKNGRLRFTSGLDLGDHLVADGEQDDSVASTEVEMRRLDDVLGAMPGHPLPRILKVDAEGWDAAVLRGAEATIARAQPLILVEVWQGGRELRAWLEERGYGVYAYDWEDGALRALPQDFAAWQCNFICVHGARLEETRRLLALRTPRSLRLPRVRWIQSLPRNP